VTRVVHVSPTAFGGLGTFGGGERYVMELARAMAVHTPTRVVTFGAEASRGDIDSVDTQVLATRTLWKGSKANPVSERLAMAISDADIVHVHQWDSVVANACVLLARMRRRPVFATDHGGAGPNYWRRLHLDRLLTGFLPVSRFSASFYPELADRSQVIHGGVDASRYAPRLGENRAGVLAVGRILPHKGLDALIRGVSPTTQVTIIGRTYDSAYRARLGELAAGKDITFVEDADDETVRRAYRTSKVSVLASQYKPESGPPSSKPELLGLALLEAMSSGCPVIATAVGGMPEIVDDGVTGFVVPPSDPAAIGDAVNTLLNREDVWHDMSVAARESVCRRFTWDATAQRCLSAYGQMSPKGDRYFKKSSLTSELAKA
jgi:glycosyltransferase involved in cell wall biosynthesis